MVSWKSAFPRNPPHSLSFIEGLTDAHNTDMRTAAFHTKWAMHERLCHRKQRREKSSLAKWGRRVETGYLKKYGVPLSQSTTQSTIKHPPSSKESSKTDEDDAWEPPKSSFSEATPCLSSTGLKLSNVSSGRYRKRLEGSKQSFSTSNV